jgi:hypothetical protein
MWANKKQTWSFLEPTWRTGNGDQREVNGSLKFLLKLWSLARQTTLKANSHESREIHVLTRSKIPHVKSWALRRTLEKRWKQSHEATEENNTFCALPDCPDWGGGLSASKTSENTQNWTSSRHCSVVNGGLSAAWCQTVRWLNNKQNDKKTWLWTGRTRSPDCPRVEQRTVRESRSRRE